MDVYESLMINFALATNDYTKGITPERLNKYTDLAYDRSAGEAGGVIDITTGELYHESKEKDQSYVHQELQKWIHYSSGEINKNAKIEDFKSARPEDIEAMKEETFLLNMPFLPWSTNYYEKDDGSIVAKRYDGKYYRSPLASDQLLLKAQSAGIILIATYGTYKALKLLKEKVF